MNSNKLKACVQASNTCTSPRLCKAPQASIEVRLHFARQQQICIVKFLRENNGPAGRGSRKQILQGLRSNIADCDRPAPTSSHLTPSTIPTYNRQRTFAHAPPYILTHTSRHTRWIELSLAPLVSNCKHGSDVRTRYEDTKTRGPGVLRSRAGATGVTDM